jgi:hypothetical protein
MQVIERALEVETGRVLVTAKLSNDYDVSSGKYPWK